MTDPVYVAQTFDPENLTFEAQEAWCLKHAALAKEKGGTFPRVTMENIPGIGFGMLMEVWAKRPEDQGEPRWAFTLVAKS